MFSVVSLSFFTCHLSQMSFLKYLRNIFHPNISPEIYAHWHFIWINIMDVCVGLLLRARPQRLSDPVSQRGWVCMATKELKEKKNNSTALHFWSGAQPTKADILAFNKRTLFPVMYCTCACPQTHLVHGFVSVWSAPHNRRSFVLSAFLKLAGVLLWVWIRPVPWAR